MLNHIWEVYIEWVQIALQYSVCVEGLSKEIWVIYESIILEQFSCLPILDEVAAVKEDTRYKWQRDWDRHFGHSLFCFLFSSCNMI